MTDHRFDLVIFDCEGVLVDSGPIINSDAETLGTIECEWVRAPPQGYEAQVGTIIADMRELAAALAMLI